MTRQEKLEKMQKLHRELSMARKPLEAEFKKAKHRLQRANKKLKECGQAIYDLKHDGVTPVVTDHAIVRYLQRVKGYDIEELKVEVANNKNAHREGNVVVTVNPTPNKETDKDI